MDYTPEQLRGRALRLAANTMGMHEGAELFAEHMRELRAHADALEKLDEAERSLEQFANNTLSDDNCSSVELAGRRVANLARAALARIRGTNA